MAPTMMTLAPLVIMALIWFCCSDTPPLANCTSGLKPAAVRPSLKSVSASTQFSLVFWGSATPIRESFGNASPPVVEPPVVPVSARPQAVSASAAIAAIAAAFPALPIIRIVWFTFFRWCAENRSGADQGTDQMPREMTSLVEVVSSGLISLLRPKFFISMPMMDFLPWDLL